MASTDSSDIFSGIKSFAGDFLGDLKNVAIDAARAKYVDVETVDSDRNIPDQADVRAGYAVQAASDATGGTFKPSFAGMTVGQWAGLSVAAVVGLVVLKKAKVF